MFIHFSFFLFLHHLTQLKAPLFFAATLSGYMCKLIPMFPHNTSGETALTKFCSLSSYVYKSSLQAGLTELTQVLPLKSALRALAYTWNLGLGLSDKEVAHTLAFYVSLVCLDWKSHEKLMPILFWRNCDILGKVFLPSCLVSLSDITKWRTA